MKEEWGKQKNGNEDAPANDCDFLNVVWNFFAVEKKHFKKENDTVCARNRYSYLDFDFPLTKDKIRPEGKKEKQTKWKWRCSILLMIVIS